MDYIQTANIWHADQQRNSKSQDADPCWDHGYVIIYTIVYTLWLGIIVNIVHVCAIK